MKIVKTDFSCKKYNGTVIMNSTCNCGSCNCNCGSQLISTNVNEKIKDLLY